MDKIANWLKAYIDAHPIDLGDSDCETVLNQLYQAYAESHESDPPEISEGFKELEEFLCTIRLKIIMLSSISAVASVVLMNVKPLSTACSMAHNL